MRSEVVQYMSEASDKMIVLTDSSKFDKRGTVKRFGLKQLGIAGISPEQEPTARQLAEIQQFVKDYQVQTIFVEKHTSSKVADSIAKATGAKVKVLDPLEADPENNKDFLENLEENMASLAKELQE